jgi:tyrosine-protein phosphatase SIW14
VRTPTAIALALIVSVSVTGCGRQYLTPGQTVADRPATFAEPMKLTCDADNCFRVTPTIYRGAQPTAESYAALKSLGVKTIVNLRMGEFDEAPIKSNGFTCVRIPMSPLSPHDDQVVAFLKAVTSPDAGPVFIHCKHGSDRTGMMLAMYRVVVQGWGREDAIAEMTRGGFGFSPIFGGLVRYVRNADVEALRERVGIKPEAKGEVATGNDIGLTAASVKP